LEKEYTIKVFGILDDGKGHLLPLYGILGIKLRGSAGDGSFRISATVINLGIAALLFSVLMEPLQPISERG